jgi:hypothetical protein
MGKFPFFEAGSMERRRGVFALFSGFEKMMLDQCNPT